MRRAIGLSVLALLAPFIGCGGAGGGSPERCGYEGWQGSCNLRSLNKVRESEFPHPTVVFEAIYMPVQDPGAPGNTPPDFREEFKVLANQEQQFRDYMMQSGGNVSCRVDSAGSGACSNVKVALALPPFNPTAEAAVAEQKKGCDQLDAVQDTPPPTGASPGGVQLPGEFFFEQNSIEVNQKLIEQANEVARIMKENPAVECVGIVGQSTYGESPSIAAERARTIKNFLLGGGVDEKRLIVFGANVRVYGTGQGIPEADPKERKVNLKVLIHAGKK